MGTHPIFESDFDCLTVQQWFSDSLTDELCLTTPLPTRERLSRPQVADSSTKELVKPPKLQYAVTLETISVVSKPVVHVNWLNTPKVRYPCLRWFPLWRCCPFPNHPCFPHRRTEDCRQVLNAKQQAANA